MRSSSFFVNKAIVPTELKRRGNPGYSRFKALRILIYFRLKRLDNDTCIVEHLKKHKVVSRTFRSLQSFRKLKLEEPTLWI